jgi:hypothetical protein
MKTRSRPAPFVMMLVALAISSSAAAQGQDVHDSGGFVGVRAGLNYEQAEDALAGASGAAGVFAGVRTGRDWAAEIELWIPGSIRDATGDPHRDILVGVSAVRRFGANRSRSYLVAGVSVARTENAFTTCFADDRPAPPGPAGVPGRTVVDCAEPDVTERRREKFTGTSTYLTGGAGVDVPLWPHVRLLPEVRVHVAIGSIIVRPAVGFRFDF